MSSETELELEMEATSRGALRSPGRGSGAVPGVPFGGCPSCPSPLALRGLAFVFVCIRGGEKGAWAWGGGGGEGGEKP